MIRRGDTLIEVILAVTIFSAVAISTLSLMNSGTAIAQRSLETTLVRQQIDSQAEMLRYISQSEDSNMVGLWSGLKIQATPSPVSVVGVDSCPNATTLSRPFVLIPSEASGVTSIDTFNENPDTFAQIKDGSSQGISIQLANVEGSDRHGGRAYDAYIQACWHGPGVTRPMTIGTIVRIYDSSL